MAKFNSQCDSHNLKKLSFFFSLKLKNIWNLLISTWIFDPLLSKIKIKSEFAELPPRENHKIPHFLCSRLRPNLKLEVAASNAIEFWRLIQFWIPWIMQIHVFHRHFSLIPLKFWANHLVYIVWWFWMSWVRNILDENKKWKSRN